MNNLESESGYQMPIDPMDAEKARADFWRSITMILLGAVLSLGTIWVVIGRGTVSAAEVTEIMDKSSPYVRDSGKLAEQLKTTNATLERIETTLKEQMAAFDNRLRKIEVKTGTLP